MTTYIDIWLGGLPSTGTIYICACLFSAVVYEFLTSYSASSFLEPEEPEEVGEDPEEEAGDPGALGEEAGDPGAFGEEAGYSGEAGEFGEVGEPGEEPPWFPRWEELEARQAVFAPTLPQVPPPTATCRYPCIGSE